jgi:predicted MFS family arabinose efflux permease
VAAAYRPLFATAEARRLVAASLLARLPMGIFWVPLFLIAEESGGSYGFAGLTTGIEALCVAVSAPVRGRLMDRYGSARVLPPFVAVHAAAMAALGLGGSPGLILALAVVLGLSAPSLVVGMRLEWQRLLAGDPRLEQAYAFESVAQVVLFVVGPMIAAAGIALAGPGATIIAAGALMLVAGLAFARRAVRLPEPAEAHGSGLGPIRIPGVLTLVAAILIEDGALGAAEVAIIAFAEGRGEDAFGGVLVAIFAASSALGGAIYGARSWRRPPHQLIAGLMLVGGLLILPLAAIDSLGLMALGMVFAGAPFAATWVTVSVALDRVAPEGQGGEAYAWFSTANAAGIAAGSAIAGPAIDAGGPSTAFVGAAAVLVLGAGFTLARGASLRQQVQ